MEITVELKTQLDQVAAAIADLGAASAGAKGQGAQLDAMMGKLETTFGDLNKRIEEQSKRLDTVTAGSEGFKRAIRSAQDNALAFTGRVDRLSTAWVKMEKAGENVTKVTDLSADALKHITEVSTTYSSTLKATGDNQSYLLNRWKQSLTPAQKQAQVLAEITSFATDAERETKAYADTVRAATAKLERLTAAEIANTQAGEKRTMTLREIIQEQTNELKASTAAGISQNKLGDAVLKTGIVSEAGAVKIGLLAAGTTAMATAALAGGAALTAMALKAYEAIDGVADLSARVGVSAEELSQFRYASSQTDVSLESLGDGVKKLGLAMSEAQVETSDQAQLFKMLGVETTDAGGKMRSTADVMVDLAGAFSSLGTEQEKLTLATKLFGKAGAELLPIFADGQAGLQGMIDKNKELGLELSGPSLKAAGDYEKASKDLSATINGLTEAIGVRFLPTLTKVVELATEAASAVRNRLMPALNNEPVKDLNSELEKLGQTMQGAFGKSAIIHVETLTEKIARLDAQKKASAEAEKQAEADRKKAQEEQVKRLEKLTGLYDRQGIELGDLNKAYAELARAVLAADKIDDGLWRGGIQGAQDYTAQIQGTTAALAQMDAVTRATGEQIASTTLSGISQLNSLAGQALSTWQNDAEAAAQASAASIAQTEKQLAQTTDALERRRLQARLATLKKQEAANEQAAVRAYRLQQASGLIGVGISTSQAIMQAMTLPPPASYIAAGFAAALGGAQAAMIASQPAPSYGGAGGSMPGSVSGPDLSANMTRASQATSQSVSAGQAAEVEAVPMNANVARAQNSSVVVTDAEYTASAGRRTLELAPGDEASVRRSGRMGRAPDESVPLLERIARTMDNLVEELMRSRHTECSYSMARKA